MPLKGPGRYRPIGSSSREMTGIVCDPAAGAGSGEGLKTTQLSQSHADREGLLWGRSSGSRSRGSTAGVGSESGPLWPMIDSGDF